MLMILLRHVCLDVHFSHICGDRIVQIDVFMNVRMVSMVIMILGYVMINVSLDRLLELVGYPNINGEILLRIFVLMNVHLVHGHRILLIIVRRHVSLVILRIIPLGNVSLCVQLTQIISQFNRLINVNLYVRI